jgi:hypothetical protein
MLLNVRRFPPDSKHPELILLAIEDITAHIQAAGAVQTPEVRYRRLFETARDGILTFDANPLTARSDITRLIPPIVVANVVKGKQPWKTMMYANSVVGGG